MIIEIYWFMAASSLLKCLRSRIFSSVAQQPN